MASTYKVPMAGLCLQLVDQGRLSLAQQVEITDRHVAETGEIAPSLVHPGVVLSVANLLELMLTQSNNNATDRILELIGGPANVTAWLRSVGITDMQIDTSVNDLLAAFYGLPAGAPAMQTFLKRYPSAAERDRISATPQPAFDTAPQDTTTPNAMIELLSILFDGPCLSDGSREFLKGVMTRCQTGPMRIKGMLPPDTEVAHKTGTIGGTVNDAGVITLPDGRGRLALAVYTRESPILPYTAREIFIADLSRLVFDYFAVAI
jgi:beta-lactamase class A